MSQAVSESGRNTEEGLEPSRFDRVFFEQADDKLKDVESLRVDDALRAGG
ncbi:MAG: hypothetical protein JSW68_06565 [Burkholderiales bacterium]|nr:MAG: hypothetical protein JSW68_06565 [Burkholderiales bacterium]